METVVVQVLDALVLFKVYLKLQFVIGVLAQFYIEKGEFVHIIVTMIIKKVKKDKKLFISYSYRAAYQLSIQYLNQKDVD